MKQLFLISFYNTFFVFAYGQPLANYSQGNDNNFFWQEYHQPFILESAGQNDVRSIAVDQFSNIWIATAAGIFKKDKDGSTWSHVIDENERGPGYAVLADNHTGVWLATWNGVYHYKDNKLRKIDGVDAPISVLCKSKEGIYALGPKGVWLYGNDHFQKKNYSIARSVQNAITDGNGGLWIATKVGLYHCSQKTTTLYNNTTQLISAYVEDVSLNSDGQLWAVGLGGVSIRQGEKMIKTLTPQNGLPTVYATCIVMAPDGSMWVGTQKGIVRYETDGTHSLRFSRRWLVNDDVKDISFDTEGNAWIATSGGV
ncbi:MAG: two-component regulator propeller domain-containing protein, partial [Ginsengibacter sp.]